jgi:hypothetical protein
MYGNISLFVYPVSTPERRLIMGQFTQQDGETLPLIAFYQAYGNQRVLIFSSKSSNKRMTFPEN